MSKYLSILIVSGIIPLIVSFYPPLKFYQNKKALLFSVPLIVLIFGAWDVFAAYRGHWYFNHDGIIGVWIGNLPIEEWLFFIVIPFCCIFTWEVILYLKRNLK